MSIKILRSGGGGGGGGGGGPAITPVTPPDTEPTEEVTKMNYHIPKNYTTDGGNKTVIGGELEILEGAKVSGLSSALVLDLGGVNIQDAMDNPVDVTEAVPVEVFEAAAAGDQVLLIKGLIFNNAAISVQSAVTMAGEGIMAMGPFNGGSSTARISVIGSLLLFRSGRKVLLSTAFIPLADDGSVTGVTLSRDSISCNTGDSNELNASVQPADTTNRDVYWRSSDPDIAGVYIDVDQEGTYEPVEADTPLDCDTTVIIMAGDSAGSATITVTTVDGGYTDTCDVTVEDVSDPEA